MQPTSKRFKSLVVRLSTKGFLDTVYFIRENNGCHYNDVVRLLMDGKVVGSRASVTTILNSLLDLGLVDREISDTKPIRTTYRLTSLAKDILHHLEAIQELLG